MNKYEELQEYIKNKINKIDKEIAQLQAKREAYQDIDLELCTFSIKENEN